MSCCEPSAPTVAAGICPACRTKSVPVAVMTVKALLTPDGLREGIPQAPRFCGSPGCPVVYFDDVSLRCIREDELSVRVYAKHSNDDASTVCYCFGYTVGTIRNSAARKVISRDVRAQVEAGHCACEVKNPKGACCLGDIVKVEREGSRNGVEAQNEDSAVSDARSPKGTRRPSRSRRGTSAKRSADGD